MKSSGVGRIAGGLSFILLSALALAMAATGGYHLLKKYTFGAAEGSTREYFDYITVDSSARRVYLSHGTEIKVIDADNGTLIGNITGMKQDHGVALAHELGRGFISDGAEGKVVIFDLKTLKVTGGVKADKDADSVIYDPASKRVFAMNGDPNSSTVIDAESGTVVGTIALGGAPEFAVADGKGTVYVNLEDKNELLAIDSGKLTIKSGQWRQPEGPRPSPWTNSTGGYSVRAAIPRC
jgi:DNA-binding beta-propeller fold protein YncE